jgi:hypothetical protein
MHLSRLVGQLQSIHTISVSLTKIGPKDNRRVTQSIATALHELPQAAADGLFHAPVPWVHEG